MDTGKLVLVVLLLAIVVVASMFISSSDPASGLLDFAAHGAILLGGALLLIGMITLAITQLRRPQRYWMHEPRNRQGRWMRSQKMPSLQDIVVMDWLRQNTSRPRQQALPPAPENKDY